MSDEIWRFVLVLGASGIMPGPDIVAILARSLAGGWRASLFLIAGIVLGHVCWMLAIAMGLTMVLVEDEHPSWIKEARTLPYVQRGKDWLTSLVPEEVQERSRQAVDAVEEKAYETLGEAAKSLPIPESQPE